MTKTTSFLNVLHYITQTPNRCITQAKMRELLGNPPKSSWNRQINELTEDSADVPAMLLKTKDSETGEINYCLNHRGWQAFLDAHTEGGFLLECYRQTGYLLDSNFTNMIFDLPDTNKREKETLSRKFLNLVKIKTQKSDKLKEVLDSVIQALISEKQVELTYEGEIRIFRPYTLITHRDDLYVMGQRRKGESNWEERMYKLSRISKIKILTIGFPYPERKTWDPVKKFQEASGLIVETPKKVTLRVYGHSRKIFSEKDFFGASLINRDADFDTYICAYSHPNEFLGQLFVYAQDVEIVDDEDLKQLFIDKAQEALSRNSKGIKKLA